ncbi:MAG: hypothetical protein A2X56_14250 [Nitrospirae bacterium GWC2_57_13]|jgi:hypothetical protein|nr:MAG: hypothetical protein A2X56_14250 [Nitrospirae bacterium GWC2_57_13]OGW44170.1 MAG: hypothetical protein A2X57_10345 [Nitrospirae bacterium GWD2_57_8]
MLQNEMSGAGGNFTCRSYGMLQIILGRLYDNLRLFDERLHLFMGQLGILAVVSSLTQFVCLVY